MNYEYELGMFLVLLTITGIAFKLLGWFTASWLFVFAPLWLPFSIGCVCLSVIWAANWMKSNGES